METVVSVIGLSEKQAIALMMRIHEEGMAIAWTGSKDEAEEMILNIREVGLGCFISEIPLTQLHRD